jgi:hypothetical protein
MTVNDQIQKQPQKLVALEPYLDMIGGIELRSGAQLYGYF